TTYTLTHSNTPHTHSNTPQTHSHIQTHHLRTYTLTHSHTTDTLTHSNTPHTHTHTHTLYTVPPVKGQGWTLFIVSRVSYPKWSCEGVRTVITTTGPLGARLVIWEVQPKG